MSVGVVSAFSGGGFVDSSDGSPMCDPSGSRGY